MLHIGSAEVFSLRKTNTQGQKLIPRAAALWIKQRNEIAKAINEQITKEKIEQGTERVHVYFNAKLP